MIQRADRPAISEHIVQRALFAMLSHNQSFLMPNFTPRGWWECDMAVVTKSGLFVEYEIKLTKADLMADAKKHRERRFFTTSKKRDKRRIKRLPEHKHDLLKNGHTVGPSRFFYVVPIELIEHIPDWAGIITAVPGAKGKIKTFIHRKAPQLHRHHIHRRVIDQMKTSAYWRYTRIKLEENRTQATAPQEARQ